ncbi:MAG TPA: hypothetical protein VFH61_10095 [Thermoleophilia bacterium]|nr:hypothetical protein [Thermoleophilia bacterium]
MNRRNFIASTLGAALGWVLGWSVFKPAPRKGVPPGPIPVAPEPMPVSVDAEPTPFSLSDMSLLGEEFYLNDKRIDPRRVSVTDGGFLLHAETLEKVMAELHRVSLPSDFPHGWS